ncbi:ABC transporter permease [Pseudonocardia sp. NPDC046786]|uniref:ABC transporter permease n=1 Tax=Pseudonocardia sp. NPDC046786 TaxID=3155471 RepID=UPI003411DE77
MTTRAAPHLPAGPARATAGAGFRQSLALAWRSLIQLRNNPWELADYSIQPVMFVLLFTFVFGGAIAGSSDGYLDYALPGVIVMNMLFVTLYVGMGLNEDLTQGFFDRLRSMPLAAWAPLAGRILADTVKQAWSIVLLLGIGFLLGFRVQSSVFHVLAAVGLILVAALAFSWVTILIGLLATSPTQTQLYGYSIIFPIAFVSSVFVPADTMPDWLQPIAEGNPVSTLTDAVRGLLSGAPFVDDALASLIAALAITVVAVPICLTILRRTT